MLYCIGVLFLTMLPVAVQAQYTFTTNNGTITITGYNYFGGIVQALVIPSATNGYPITSIGNAVFEDRAIGSVIIPNTITNIGNDAFSDCLSLTNVTLSTNLTIIGDNVFSLCGLNSVTIPNSVTTIGTNAFAQCGSLTNIVIPGTVTNIQNGAFFSSALLQILCLGNAPAVDPDADFPNGAKVYYVPGTSGWGSLLSNAQTVKLYSCTTNNNTITITGYSAYSGPVYFPDNISGMPVTTIGNEAFYNLANVTGITLGTNVTSIGKFAFEESALTNIAIPDGVTNIATYAFSFCSDLTSVTIPASVTIFGDSAFLGCNKLTNITIAANIIGNSAFGNCTALRSIIIPNCVTSIGSAAFGSCTNLSDVIIPNSITNIGNDAFSDCLSLTSITIPASVTSIGSVPFGACHSLTNISVDAANPVFSSLNGVLFDKAEKNLIEYPEGLTSSAYTIPGSVTNIGDYAFSGCTNLTSIFSAGNAPSAGSTALSGSSVEVVFYLPGTTGWGSELGGFPAALWNPQAQTRDGSFGIQNGEFGFNITGTTNIPIVVEACTNIANPVWTPLQSCVLTNGSIYFSDLQWTNNPRRFYGFSWP